MSKKKGDIQLQYAKRSRLNVGTFKINIDKKYEIARRYYAQRRRMFMEYLLKEQGLNGITDEQLQQLEEILVNDVMTKCAKAFDELVENYKRSATKAGIVELNGDKGSYVFTSKIFETAGEGKTNLDVLAKNLHITVNEAETVIKQGSGQSFSSIMGTLYEFYVARNLHTFAKQVDETYNNSINEIVGTFLEGVNKEFNRSGFRQVGKQTTLIETAMRAENVQSSIDVGSNVLSSKGLIKASEVDIKGRITAGLGMGDMNKRRWETRDLKQTLSNYLDPSMSSIYGFQLKRYKGISGESFRTSSLTQGILNQYYSHDSDKTWAGKYAYYFMLSFLADNLVSLLGPLLIGVFFGNKFIFMDDLVNNWMFSHLIKIKNTDPDTLLTAKDYNKEIKPEITDSHVYMYNYGKAMSWFDLKITGNKYQNKKNKDVSITLEKTF